MSGFFTNGLPVVAVPQGTEIVPADAITTTGTGAASVGISVAQVSDFGLGTPIVLTDAATITPDVSLGSLQTVTLGGNRTFGAFANPTPGQIVVLEVKQDATGSRTITWNANVSWASGSAPTLTTTANATDVLRFTWNPTAAKWRGETVGKAFA